MVNADVAVPIELSFPDTSVNLTANVPVPFPALTIRACSAELDVTPRSNVAVVSVAPIATSTATTVAVPTFGVKSSSALPPVTSPTTNPATDAVIFVLVEFTKFATAVPPTIRSAA